MTRDNKPVVYRSRTTEQTFKEIYNRLDAGDPFFYVRNGDGELGTIQGAKHRQYQDPPQELRDLLKEALLIDHPKYLIGMNDIHEKESGMAKGMFWDPTHQNIVRSGLRAVGVKPGKVFENAIALHYYYCFKRKELFNLLDLIKPKKCMYVGGQCAEESSSYFGGYEHRVQIPLKEAFYQIDNWFPKVESGLKKCEVIISASGWCANVIALALWKGGWEGTYLDLGSLVDALIGVKDRKWIKLAQQS